MSSKAKVNSMLRRVPLARAALDGLPVRVTLPDGSRRSVPRSVARLIHTWGSHAECRAESAAVLEAYAGGDLLDVGAFHGWYSLLLAHRMAPGSRAVPLEPDLHASSNLMRVLAEASYLYPAVAFAMLPVAVGDGSAMRVSFPGGGHPCFTSGDDSSTSASRTATIDGLVAGLRINPGFVKIDVEGAESFVLAGMHETISCFRPRIMLEVHHTWQPEGRSTEQLSERLMGFGYRQSSIHRSEIADRQLWVPR